MDEKINRADAEAQFFKNVGFRIQYYRRMNNLSQEELAEKTDLSVSTISHIESSAPYTLSLKALCRVAAALDVEPYKFLFFD